MPELGTSGSVGAAGGQLPAATQPDGKGTVADSFAGRGPKLRRVTLSIIMRIAKVP